MSWALRRRGVAAVGTVAAVAAGLTVAGTGGAATGSASSSTTHTQRVVAVGRTAITPGASAATRYDEKTGTINAGNSVYTRPEGTIPRLGKQKGKAVGNPATVAVSSTVVDANPSGFPGLTHRDQRVVADGGNQWTLEPPDQGLCVHGGQVLEAVNDAYAVYDTAGNELAGPISLNQFFTHDHALDRTDPDLPAGAFISDPRCIFDTDTQRWFMTVLEEDALEGDAQTSAAHTMVAVSDDADALGSWQVFSFDVTNDTGKAVPDSDPCPCFGDQPLIGADAHGLYITTNVYPQVGGGFYSAQVYALDKFALADNATTDVVKVALPDPADALPSVDGAYWYSLQPATTPVGGAAYADGTELFASALQFGPSNFDDKIALWKLSGTDTLGDPHPSLSMHVDIVHSEVYGNPVPMTQKENKSLRPLGKLLHEPLETVDSNDDRMQQAVYAGGRLWTGLNTMVLNGNGKILTGIAWFAINPATATMAKQGYVALSQDQNVAFPAIGINADGNGAIGFSAMGPNLYPSTGYIRVGADGTTGPVHLAGLGQAPDDGYSGYVSQSGVNHGRWGDYSAAVADESGQIWLAQEYIPNAPRTLYANWGTFITHVQP